MMLVNLCAALNLIRVTSLAQQWQHLFVAGLCVCRPAQFGLPLTALNAQSYLVNA